MSDCIRQLEMDLLFAIVLLLYDNVAEPYHTSHLDADSRYEEIINHKNDYFLLDNIRKDKTTFLNLLDFLKNYGDLEDGKHVKASQMLIEYLTVFVAHVISDPYNIWHFSGSM